MTPETTAMITACFDPYRDDTEDARWESELEGQGDVRCAECGTERDPGHRDCDCCGGERWEAV